jgi:hypothetical protein
LKLDVEKYMTCFTECIESIREVSKHKWKIKRSRRNIHHINRNGCDNTFPNIKDASQKVIMRNHAGDSNNTSGQDPDYDIEKLNVDEKYKVKMREAERKYDEQLAKRKRARDADEIAMMKPDLTDFDKYWDD